MMEKIKITPELLTLFLDGKASPAETYAIQKATRIDWKARFILHMAKLKGIICLNLTHLLLPALFIFASCNQRDPWAEYEIIRDTEYSTPQEGIDRAQEYIDYFYGKKKAQITEVTEIRDQYHQIECFFSNMFCSYEDFLSQSEKINRELTYSRSPGVRKMWVARYEETKKRLLELTLANITETDFEDFFRTEVRKQSEQEFHLWEIVSMEQMRLEVPSFNSEKTAKESSGEYLIHLRIKVPQTICRIAGKALTEYDVQVTIEGTIGVNDAGQVQKTRTNFKINKKPILS